MITTLAVRQVEFTWEEFGIIWRALVLPREDWRVCDVDGGDVQIAVSALVRHLPHDVWQLFTLHEVKTQLAAAYSSGPIWVSARALAEQMGLPVVRYEDGRVRVRFTE